MQRVRSNNIMVDGQDSNDPSVTGRHAADQQHRHRSGGAAHHQSVCARSSAASAGSVMNVITKSGTNDFQRIGIRLPSTTTDLNSRSNLDKDGGPNGRHRSASRASAVAPLGGPIAREPHVLLRLDSSAGRSIVSSDPASRLNGAPTEAGRAGPAVSRPAACHRYEALLKHLPAGAGANRPRTASFTLATASRITVPLGSLTGIWIDGCLNNNQANGPGRPSVLSQKHTLDRPATCSAIPVKTRSPRHVQVTPPGQTLGQRSEPATRINVWLTSVLSGRSMSNEFRVAQSASRQQSPIRTIRSRSRFRRLKSQSWD